MCIRDSENMKAMVSKPYAKVLKEAFPHATFVGFTGTPIAETYQTFGDEIDRYTMAVSYTHLVIVFYICNAAVSIVQTYAIFNSVSKYSNC